MRTLSLRSTPFRVVALAFLGAVPGCNIGKTCTDMGCTSGARMRSDFQSAAATLTGQTATVCRNSECYAAVMPAPSEAGTGRPFSFAGTTTVDGTLWRQPDQTSQLDVFWQFPYGSPGPRSGDHYVVNLTDSAGKTTAVFDKTTTSYERLSPNGDDCGPICWQAIFPP